LVEVVSACGFAGDGGLDAGNASQRRGDHPVAQHAQRLHRLRVLAVAGERDRHPGEPSIPARPCSCSRSYAEPGYALEPLQQNAEGIGYLLKDRINDLPEFTAAVRRVAAGGSALDSSVVSQLVGRRRRDDPLADLTPREREVLELMAEGLSNVAIAERIVVTERAVEKHVTSIFQKLRLPAAGETHRRVLAVLTYLRS
jgi:DNA-binding NarL/FixJ family response regulator